MMLSALEAALVKGDIPQSIELLRNWLVGAHEGEPEQLLSECSPAARPKLVLLMRDLLSRYPSTLVGAPVLVFARPDVDSTRGPTAHAFLPYPTYEAARPCEDLHFLGWLPVGTQLPVAVPFRPERYTTKLPWFKSLAAVAVFRSHPGVFDLEELELPNQWWGELFRPVEADMNLSSRLVLPYPDALEAAAVMQAVANGDELPARGHFLSDAVWHYAREVGALFHETCRHHYSDDI